MDRRCRGCATVGDLQWTNWVRANRVEFYWGWMWMSFSPCYVTVWRGALHCEQRELPLVCRYKNREFWWRMEGISPTTCGMSNLFENKKIFSSKHKRGLRGKDVFFQWGKTFFLSFMLHGYCYAAKYGLRRRRWVAMLDIVIINLFQIFLYISIFLLTVHAPGKVFEFMFSC